MQGSSLLGSAHCDPNMQARSARPALVFAAQMAQARVLAGPRIRPGVQTHLKLARKTLLSHAGIGPARSKVAAMENWVRTPAFSWLKALNP